MIRGRPAVAFTVIALTSGAAAVAAPDAPATAATLPSCDIRQLDVTAKGGPGLSGHVGFLVHVVNASTRSCLVTGYPRVSVLDASGHRLQAAVPTKSGYIGGLQNGGTAPVINLRPGGMATSMVEGTDQADPPTCGTPTVARVGLPHVTAWKAAAIAAPSFYACPGVQVHPFLPGSAGFTRS